MTLTTYWQSLLLTLCFFSASLLLSVSAVPTWEGLNGRTSIGSLVPGASYIEALGPAGDSEINTQHLSVINPGLPSNLTVIQNYRAPPLFYIKQNQLWQFVNETTIYPVNLINVTGTSDFPLQLVVGKNKAGVTSGSWRWRGTMLYYDQGTQGNQGLYYSCKTENSFPGIFMFLNPSPTPTGCGTLTLHSFIREYVDKR